MPQPLSASPYDVETITWVRQRVEEGEQILKQEPGYKDIESNIAYVMGDQLSRRPAALSCIKDNLTKKAVLETVAAVTDIRPLFGFRTSNQLFQTTSDILDKLARAWWISSFADLSLGDTVRYAAGAGTGYSEMNWDPSAAGGLGDIVLTAVDPRDVLPINPKLGISCQSWGGVIIRSMETVETLQRRYGVRAAGLTPDRGMGTMAGKLWGQARPGPIVTPSVVDSLNMRNGHNMPVSVPAKELYKVYFKDDSVHTGPTPITMGEPGTSWAYTVYPVGYRLEDGSKVETKRTKLYPRGRLIVATKDRILFDGPNPYWHGMFPISKLTLDPWPWSLLGGSLVSDLRSLQDGLNDVLNGFADHVKKVLRPDIVGDKNSVPQSVWNRIDTRVPGQKILQNPTAGKGIEILDPKALPPEVEAFITYLVQEIEKLSGTMNLAQLAQLNQMPAADSIEKMMEALSPILRLKGRVLEGHLREIGEMFKVMVFQFYTMPRRIAYLGEEGIDMHDFDYDPGTLVPSMVPSDQGYQPELNQSLSVSDRANHHHHNFAIQIQPNSLLALNQLSRKMTYLQLWRGGLMDPWSLWEVLEIPNAGQPPPGATTITDRLMVASMMGLTGQVSPAGRKASGQEPPQMKNKTDEDGGQRQTVSESG